MHIGERQHWVHNQFTIDHEGADCRRINGCELHVH